MTNLFNRVPLESITPSLEPWALKLCDQSSDNMPPLEPTGIFDISLDLCHTDIDDRILLSNNITSDASDEAGTISEEANVGSARFLTNAVDTSTRGYELCATHRHSFDSGLSSQLKIHYPQAQTRITGYANTPELRRGEWSWYSN